MSSQDETFHFDWKFTDKDDMTPGTLPPSLWFPFKDAYSTMRVAKKHNVHPSFASSPDNRHSDFLVFCFVFFLFPRETHFEF